MTLVSAFFANTNESEARSAESLEVRSARSAGGYWTRIIGYTGEVLRTYDRILAEQNSITLVFVHFLQTHQSVLPILSASLRFSD